MQDSEVFLCLWFSNHEANDESMKYICLKLLNLDH